MTLCYPTDCSPPGSSVHGILQARILEYTGLPCPSPGDLTNPGIEPRSPALQVDSFPSEPPGKHMRACFYNFCRFIVLSLFFTELKSFYLWCDASQFKASQAAPVVKNLPANAGDIRHVGSILGLGRSPRGGHGNPLQYSCLKNPMDRGAWRATVHRVTKSRIRLSD